MSIPSTAMWLEPADDAVMMDCPICDGLGVLDRETDEMCVTCQGTGEVVDESDPDDDFDADRYNDERADFLMDRNW